MSILAKAVANLAIPFLIFLYILQSEQTIITQLALICLVISTSKIGKPPQNTKFLLVILVYNSSKIVIIGYKDMLAINLILISSSDSNAVRDFPRQHISVGHIKILIPLLNITSDVV